jgi:hypothetical protein
MTWILATMGLPDVLPGDLTFCRESSIHIHIVEWMYNIFNIYQVLLTLPSILTLRQAQHEDLLLEPVSLILSLSKGEAVQDSRPEHLTCTTNEAGPEIGGLDAS